LSRSFQKINENIIFEENVRDYISIFKKTLDKLKLIMYNE
jgi:hypothetical protein